LTNGTVGYVFPNVTVMIMDKFHIDTHSTVIAMLKVFFPPYTANSTIFAMIRFFCGRHPKITCVAVIFAKLNMTFDTVITIFSNGEKQA
jgi:hypothetical protein